MLFGYPFSDYFTSEALENDPMGSQIEPNMETKASENGSKKRWWKKGEQNVKSMPKGS